MNDLLMQSALILAQSTTPASPTSPASPTGPSSSPFGGPVFLAAILAMVVFMFMSARSQKKREQRKRDELYAGLTKNDRVLTIGGVLGTIVSVKDNEVVVKVDESTNTKMTFLKSAIQKVVADDRDLSDEKK